MRILVLGGTGAMGADLVKILGERGDEVTVTSRSERRSVLDNVTYAMGDALDMAFLRSLLTERFDAIVDFMIYSTEEFKARRDLLLGATNQYFFLSSSRVYAESKTPITEDSPRLLDTSNDSEYLKTDEYALTKARQEDLLCGSGRTNWTVIRPYITYSAQRLQLGIYEKELWLYRALHGMTTVFPKIIAEKYTTMTLGKDVAGGISKLIGSEKALGEMFHITTDKAIKWSDVLSLYEKVFRDVTGEDIKIKYVNDTREILGNNPQAIYDRHFDRRFDNRKFLDLVGGFEFEDPTVGLERCLREFLSKPVFREIPVNAKMDKIAGERTRLAEISGYKMKAKYLAARYLPDSVLHCVKLLLRNGLGCE